MLQEDEVMKIGQDTGMQQERIVNRQLQERRLEIIEEDPKHHKGFGMHDPAKMKLVALATMILSATALPCNADKTFLSTTLDIKDASIRPPFEVTGAAREQLAQMLAKVIKLGAEAQMQLLITMLNHGNYVEIAAELARQLQDENLQRMEGFVLWQKIAAYIVQLAYDESFIQMRTMVVALTGQPEQQLRVAYQAKELILHRANLGIPVRWQHLVLLNYDMVGNKVRPAGVENFLSRSRPAFLKTLGYGKNLPLLLQAQREAKMVFMKEIQTANESMQASASRSGGQTFDRGTSTLQLLEVLHAATPESNHGGVDQLRGTSDRELMLYLFQCVPIFIAGILPGASVPVSVFACQDPISFLQLQHTIQDLAQNQILQAAQTSDSGAVIQKMAQMTNVAQSGQFTPYQAQSITQQLVIQRNVMVTGKNMSSSYGNRDLDPFMQADGGSNSMQEASKFEGTGDLIKLQDPDKELLQQQVSILLACLRVRFDSLVGSSDELCSQVDVTHIYICMRLFPYFRDAWAAAALKGHCEFMIKAIVDGSNATKLTTLLFNTDPQLLNNVRQVVSSYLSSVLSQMAIFSSDKTKGGDGLSIDEFVSDVYTSLVTENRIDREVAKRTQKRAFLFQVNKYY